MKPKKSVSSDGLRTRLERQAMNLSKRCPVDRSNPINCPLCDLRLLGARVRRVWVHALTLEELQYLVLYHANCASVKMCVALRPRKVRVTAA